jgi:pimeloyl-ACP methyl ester carboxylesterase
MADRCAPSRSGGLGFESTVNPIAPRMMADGAIVVEPDYLGLGPPGPHPYTAALPTGRSVLDAIRAAERFVDGDLATGPAPFVLLEGHSQGGHAVLSTLAVAADQAPELVIPAAVAIAPPGEPREMLDHVLGGGTGGGFAAMAMVGWSWAHPEMGSAEDLVRDEDLLDELDHDCLLGLGGRFDDPLEVLVSVDALEAIPEAVFEAEDLGALATDTELLVVHGTEDELLPIALTEAYVERMTAAGTSVTFLPVEGGDHLMLPRTAKEPILGFLEDALGE